MGARAFWGKLMTFKMTDRAKAAKVRRTWYCDECEHQWNTVDEPGSADLPECPMCAAEPEQVLKPFGVKTNVSRAVEAAHRMVETDYGMTDMNDNLRPGDIAAKGPASMQTAEAEAITRELVASSDTPEAVAPHLKQQVTSFFNGGSANLNPNTIASAVPQTLDAARAMAAPGVMASRSMKADPVGLLHAAGKNPAFDPLKNLKVHAGK